jgi:hypothetical protein
MMIHDLKKGIATVMSTRKDPETEELSSAPMKAQVVKDEDGEIDGRHAAAEDILAAIHAKDPMKLVEALGNFHDLHELEKDPEEEESEEK